MNHHVHSIVGVIAAAGGLMAFGGCCPPLPDSIWNETSFSGQPPGTTWRCQGPVGETCFTFYREGHVEITEASGLGTGVHNWESTCGGMILYGPFHDEAVLTGFSGDIATRQLSFHMRRDDVEIAGDNTCTLEDVDPDGHVCP